MNCFIWKSLFRCVIYKLTPNQWTLSCQTQQNLASFSSLAKSLSQLKLKICFTFLLKFHTSYSELLRGRSKEVAWTGIRNDARVVRIVKHIFWTVLDRHDHRWSVLLYQGNVKPCPVHLPLMRSVEKWQKCGTCTMLGSVVLLYSYTVVRSLYTCTVELDASLA